MTIVSADFDGSQLVATFSNAITSNTGWRGFTIRGSGGLQYIPERIVATSGPTIIMAMLPNGTSSGTQRLDYDGTPTIARANGGALLPFSSFPVAS